MEEKDEQVTVLTDLVPDPTGGGSIVRAAATIAALAADRPVRVVILVAEPVDTVADALNGYTISGQVELDVLPTSELNQAGRVRRSGLDVLALVLPALANRLLPPFGVPDLDQPRGPLWVLKSRPFAGRRLPRDGFVVVDIDDLEERALGGRRNARRLARHIAAVARRRRALSIAQRMLVCSEIDRQRLRSHAKVIILPNTYLIGRSLPDAGTPRSDVAPVVAMVGRMSYGPNREGAEWFLASCWPAVKRSCPQTRLRFVGFGVTDLETGGDDSIELVESPSEVAPWLSDVAVVISPLLRGSGTRVKILEAMALQKPVVSTVVGAEGLDITDGVDILLADTPDRFSAATRRLLDEPDLAIRIAQRGHQLFETRYGFGNFQTQVRCILPPPEPPRSIEQ